MAEKSSDDEVLEIYRDIYKRQNEHQLSYNKTIFGLGYGGALGIWALLRSEISPTSAAVVGLLMIISLASYLIFEIAQMLISMRHGHRLSDVLEAGGTAEERLAAARIVQTANDETHRRFLNPGWYVSIFVSVTTAFGAAIYLTILLVLKLFAQV